MEPKLKFFYPSVKTIDKENRRITVCISEDEIDRHSERVEIQAIADALAGYAPNPVVLGDHQHRLLTGESSVIGHALPESFRVLADEVDMDIDFSTTKNAETYWINYRDGHQRAISIGFIDLEFKYEEVDGRRIFVTTKLELLEVSCCAVGANRGALVKAKGMFDRQADIQPAKESPESFAEQLNDLKAIIETRFDEVKSLLIADPDGLAEGLLGYPPESSVRSGDEKTAEQIVSTCKQMNQK